jgi:hypothetical protein
VLAIAALAEFERYIIRERIKSGMARAKLPWTVTAILSRRRANSARASAGTTASLFGRSGRGSGSAQRTPLRFHLLRLQRRSGFRATVVYNEACDEYGR